MEDRARDVVRQVRDDVVRRRRRARSGPGRARRPRSSVSRPAAISVREVARARNAARPRSSSTAVTAAPASSRPLGQDPEPGPDLEDPAARRRRRLGEDRLEDVGVGEEVLGHRGRGGPAGRRPGASGGRRAASTRGGAVAWRRRLQAPRRPLSAGQRQRRPGVEVEAGPLAGGEPSGAGRADHRPVVGAQRRAAGTISGRPQRLRLAREAGPERAVRGDAAAEDDRPGADRLGRPDRLRHEHVDDRVLEAPGELRGRVVGEAASGSRRRRPVAAPRRRGPRRRPPGRRLQAREAEVVACRRATPAGTRRRGGVAASAARWIAGPPGYARPSSRPTLSNASPAASSTVWPSSRYVRWSRISTRNVWPPDTISATSGKTGSSRSASPGSSSQAA